MGQQQSHPAPGRTEGLLAKGALQTLQLRKTYAGFRGGTHSKNTGTMVTMMVTISDQWIRT